MSPRSSKPAPAGDSPSPDIYVGLLCVALGALALGCYMLYMELAKYNMTLSP